ncbi:alpha/beta fold hydrolase [Paracoccus sp. Ld10]|uniref:alpha/beta fold hydrolase n=1 Tax=Paracoccus sp. Ld10 TaxID=649158 RepID=UPI003869CB1F
MTRDTLKSGDTTLSIRIDGDADKPWIVLSNSLATDLHMWDDQIALLSQTHRIVRYDTRGHGQSGVPDGPYDFDMLVGDMLAVLDHVGADTADVMGLSLGGMTALGLGLTHPGRVRRMVVCDARADNPPPFVSGWDDRIALIENGGMEAIAPGTLDRWFTDTVTPDVVARANAMICGTPVAGYVACARALQGLGYLGHLHNLYLPVLYVVGEEDHAAPVAAMQGMTDATPGATLTVLPGLAHVPNMQDPAAFGAAVLPWLRG